MRTANLDLARQRKILETLFYYDEDLQVHINKANDKVQYLARKTLKKKILLFILICLLGIIFACCLIFKMFG